MISSRKSEAARAHASDCQWERGPEPSRGLWTPGTVTPSRSRHLTVRLTSHGHGTAVRRDRARRPREGESESKAQAGLEEGRAARPARLSGPGRPVHEIVTGGVCRAKGPGV
eukprot:2924929-Rhodomonas_salina.1